MCFSPGVVSSPRPLPARRAYRPEGRLSEPEAARGKINFLRELCASSEAGGEYTKHPLS